MIPPNTGASDWLGLSARVAVVTGAASGIGAAITRSLAQAGAHVALLDLDAGGAEALAQEIRTAGGTALAVACDIASASATPPTLSRADTKVARERRRRRRAEVRLWKSLMVGSPPR